MSSPFMNTAALAELGIDANILRNLDLNQVVRSGRQPLPNYNYTKAAGYNPIQGQPGNLPIRSGGTSLVPRGVSLPPTINVTPPNAGFTLGAQGPLTVEGASKGVPKPLQIGLNKFMGADEAAKYGRVRQPFVGPLPQVATGSALPAQAGKLSKLGVLGQALKRIPGVGTAISALPIWDTAANDIDDVAAIKAWEAKGKQVADSQLQQIQDRDAAISNLPYVARASEDLSKLPLSQFSFGGIPNATKPSTELTLKRGAGKYGEDVISNQAGLTGLGGFARPSTWKENLAFQDEQHRLIQESADRQQNETLKQRQIDMMGMLGDAVRGGSKSQMAALAPLMQAMSGVQPYDYGTQNLHQAQAAIAGPAALNDAAYKQAHAKMFEAQAANYPEALKQEKMKSRMSTLLKVMEMQKPDAKVMEQHKMIIDEMENGPERDQAVASFKQKYGIA